MQHVKSITNLVDEYYLSSDFNMLADKTKVDYQYFLGVMLGTSVDTKKLSATQLKNMSGAKARRAYEVWLKRGIFMANHVCSVARKLYSFAMEMGYAESNPFATFRRKATQTRKVVWTKEQVCQFLDYAYSDFKYRNIGLIVQMAYEWCQRVGDMRTLEWDNIHWDTCRLHLEQSKRRAEVFLPISEDLMDMLREQHKDFGFQRYVAPHPSPIQGVFNPYTLARLSKNGRAIMREARLPETLRLMDLRRTGVTQMVDAGVPVLQVMSVTGHTHVSSVQPYMKHTYDSANNALTQRSNSLQSAISSNTESDSL